MKRKCKTSNKAIFRKASDSDTHVDCRVCYDKHNIDMKYKIDIWNEQH